MAEFCLECFNELNDTHFTKEDVIEAFDFCECCAEYKKCIVKFRGHSPLSKLIRSSINAVFAIFRKFCMIF